MIRINLLPHRALKRAALQKQFFIIAGAVAVMGVAVWFLVHTVLTDQIENQLGRNKYLEGEITVLDKQIEEIKKLREQTDQLLQRKKVVESLQANRAEAVRLLEELARQLPDGVYLKSLKQTGLKVNVVGLAQSNARVSTLMRNIESSPWLGQPALIEIKTTTINNVKLSEFQMSFSVIRQQQEQPAKKPAAKPTASLPAATPTIGFGPANRIGG